MITRKQQRMLPLAFQILIVLIILSFTNAQTSGSNDTTPFILLVPDEILLCADISISWSGGNTVPPYRLFLARGDGTLGDDNSLDPEELLDAPYETETIVSLGNFWGMSYMTPR